MTSHGMYCHPAYAVWTNMLARCRRSTHPSWKDYGARGIYVCKEWEADFRQFWEDMGPTYQKGLSLDRKNNNEGYHKSNCHWATRLQQATNTRKNRYIETPWGILSLRAASRQAKLSYSGLVWRLKNEWPQDKLFIPKGIGKWTAR